MESRTYFITLYLRRTADTVSYSPSCMHAHTHAARTHARTHTHTHTHTLTLGWSTKCPSLPIITGCDAFRHAHSVHIHTTHWREKTHSMDFSHIIIHECTNGFSVKTLSPVFGPTILSTHVACTLQSLFHKCMPHTEHVGTYMCVGVQSVHMLSPLHFIPCRISPHRNRPQTSHQCGVLKLFDLKLWPLTRLSPPTH